MHGLQWERMATLVLLHAFPFSGAMYRDDVAALSPRMRVLTPTMRGTSIDAMADAVAASLDREGVREPVVVGGISMGGYVSLAFARRHADRLRGLVLADTRAQPDSDEGRASRDAGIARVRGGDYAGFVEGMLDKLVLPEQREATRALAMQQAPADVVDALHALRDRPDARPGLSAIRVPTLVLVGDRDAITPRSDAEAMRAAIPNAELVVIEEAAHLTNLDRPAAFREAIASFVSRL